MSKGGAVYIFDTSAFIAAWSEAYPIESFPVLWKRLDELIQQGRLIAPYEVFRELGKKDGDAHAWLKPRKNLFRHEDEQLQISAAEVLRQFPKLMKAGGSRGAADPWVVALARVERGIVVTKEDMGSEQKPKIPYACRHYGLECVKVLAVIRGEGWTF